MHADDEFISWQTATLQANINIIKNNRSQFTLILQNLRIKYTDNLW